MILDVDLMTLSIDAVCDFGYDTGCDPGCDPGCRSYELIWI